MSTEGVRRISVGEGVEGGVPGYYISINDNVFYSSLSTCVT